LSIDFGSWDGGGTVSIQITGKEWRQELEVRLVKRCGDREIDWERREHG